MGPTAREGGSTSRTSAVSLTAWFGAVVRVGEDMGLCLIPSASAGVQVTQPSVCWHNAARVHQHGFPRANLPPIGER
eukprot:11188224-Lingulodinium_polyedra.AAC.1